jgi:hypothetical protein
MQQINLIEARLLPPLRLLSGARLAAALLIGVASVLGHGLSERLALQRALAAAVTAESADTAQPAGVDDAASLAPLRARLAQRQALRDLLAAEPMPQDPARVLQTVIDALPPALWLSEVEVAPERTLRIAGGVLEPAAFDEFAQRLSRAAALRGSPVRSLRLEPGERADGAAEAVLPVHWRFVLATGDTATQEEAR